jgi:hypothetical protein
MLTTEVVAKAIEMYQGGATEAAVAEGTGVSPAEARAVAEAMYLGDTERLVRELALAGLLEEAAKALRSGHGFIGDTAGDVVREIWHSYPNAGVKVGRTDSESATHVGGLHNAEGGKDEL